MNKEKLKTKRHPKKDNTTAKELINSGKKAKILSFMSCNQNTIINISD